MLRSAFLIFIRTASSVTTNVTKGMSRLRTFFFRSLHHVKCDSEYTSLFLPRVIIIYPQIGNLLKRKEKADMIERKISTEFVASESSLAIVGGDRVVK
jgi:hypothetical protein